MAGRNRLESLSGIETYVMLPGLPRLRVAIALNPYQGLKLRSAFISCLTSLSQSP